MSSSIHARSGGIVETGTDDARTRHHSPAVVERDDLVRLAAPGSKQAPSPRACRPNCTSPRSHPAIGDLLARRQPQMTSDREGARTLPAQTHELQPVGSQISGRLSERLPT